jgi:hypothetical protein
MEIEAAHNDWFSRFLSDVSKRASMCSLREFFEYTRACSRFSELLNLGREMLKNTFCTMMTAKPGENRKKEEKVLRKTTCCTP